MPLRARVFKTRSCANSDIGAKDDRVVFLYPNLHHTIYHKMVQPSFDYPGYGVHLDHRVQNFSYTKDKHMFALESVVADDHDNVPKLV